MSGVRAVDLTRDGLDAAAVATFAAAAGVAIPADATVERAAHPETLDLPGSTAALAVLDAGTPPADPVRALAELHRVLATDGRLVFAGEKEPHPTWTGALGRSALFGPLGAIDGARTCTARHPAPGAAGLVASVNLSAGGVPKRAVPAALVGEAGLEGDGHDSPKHGGPDRAVCLVAVEALGRLRAEGHQAFPGAYGENLTLLGVAWDGLAEGVRLAVGDTLLLELSRPTTPCRTIAHWFTDGGFARLSHGEHPGDARWYARVVRPGPVAPGMAVRVLGAG